MTLKKLAVATLMLCAAASAMAEDKLWDAGTIPSDPGYFAYVTHTKGGFTDTVTFSVPTGGFAITANVLSVLGAGGTDQYSSHINSLNYSIWQDETNFGNYSGGLTVSKTTLTAGDYVLKITGDAVGTWGGAYGLNLAVTPVPEPTTYGMMALGLGLLGVVAKRRKSSNDKTM